MLKRLVSLLFLFGMLAAAQNATLSGTISYHNGTALNGRISVELARATALDTCASPTYIVRKAEVNIPVVAGVVTSTAQFVPTYCLVPSVPYYVQIYDSNNNLLESANWYVTPDSTGTMSVDNMVLANFGGPIVVAVPEPVVTAPIGNQTVVQPDGTWLNINRLVVTGESIGILATSFAYNPIDCPSDSYFMGGIQRTGNANCYSVGAFGVLKFAGRSGDVMPANNDYSYQMIIDSPTLGNQNLYVSNWPQPGNVNIDFTNTAFQVSNETSPIAATVVDLQPTGIAAGTYTGVTGFTNNQYGFPSAIFSASFTPAD
jgi:hypothetical protein